MPCLRQTSAVFAPASCSFNIPMICSSVNRERFIRPSPDRDGLYQILEEGQGLRSLDALDQALHDRRPFHRGARRFAQIRYDRGCCGDRLNLPNMCPFAIPSGWRRQASSRLSEVSETATTTLSPKRSTVFTRPRSSIDVGRGATSKPCSSPRWNGSTGSTTGVFWSP